MAALAPAARALVAAAETLVGGARHLALVPEGRAERHPWRSPIAASIPDLDARRGRRVVVLASGDPMCYGVGAMLARALRARGDDRAAGAQRLRARRGALEMAARTCVACRCTAARSDVCASISRRAARLLALSSDGATPPRRRAAARRRAGDRQQLTVLEHMGGPRERRLDATAADWGEERSADLNLIAIECRRGARGARPIRGSPACPTTPSTMTGR